jgi:GT2 family glycosyltransferase
MTASLIIPTYNRGEVLCETIAMALAQNYTDYEVIVVDQTPSVDLKVQAYIESVSDRVRYYRLSTPNLPAARNVGVGAAKGPIVIFIDDDVCIEQNYIALHARHYEDPSIGAVTGMTLHAPEVSAAEVLRNARALRGTNDEAKHGEALVSWVNGGNCSYRKSAILQAGMSDERFGGTAWCEDADLAVRVRHLGYKLVFDPMIKLVHLALASGGCGNREPEWTEKRDEERLQLYTFFIIKNRRILGIRALANGLVLAYRWHSLNRSILSQGVRKLLRRHVLYLACIVRAFRWSLLPGPHHSIDEVRSH